jgi:hypothetical protein
MVEPTWPGQGASKVLFCPMSGAWLSYGDGGCWCLYKMSCTFARVRIPLVPLLVINGHCLIFESLPIVGRCMIYIARSTCTPKMMLGAGLKRVMTQSVTHMAYREHFHLINGAH